MFTIKALLKLKKMEEGYELNDQPERTEGNVLNKKVLRAGKRTYFFDVKSTRENDFYITITESKKCFNTDGHYYYERHKVFLYEEDFDQFLSGLSEMVTSLKSTQEKPVFVFHKAKKEKMEDEVIEKDEIIEKIEETQDFEDVISNNYSNLEFEDLGKQ
jgi:hypothetical protein